MNEYTAAAFRACKLDHLMNGYLHKTREVVIAGAGLEGRAWQRLLNDRGIRVTAWIDVDQRKVGRVLHGASIKGITELSHLQDTLLVAIGVHGAREQFRETALPLGLKEGVDFICVA
jgi:NADH/NAD ratio-sensing transcriptional regulator Rex